MAINPVVIKNARFHDQLFSDSVSFIFCFSRLKTIKFVDRRFRFSIIRRTSKVLIMCTSYAKKENETSAQTSEGLYRRTIRIIIFDSTRRAAPDGPDRFPTGQKRSETVRNGQKRSETRIRHDFAFLRHVQQNTTYPRRQ